MVSLKFLDSYSRVFGNILGAGGKLTIEIFMWIMSVALLPAIGWALHQTWTLKKLLEMHENPAKTGFGTVGLEVIPARMLTMESTLHNMEEEQRSFVRNVDKLTTDHVQTNNRLDDLKEVISQNTEAMRELVTLIRIMDAKIKSQPITELTE